MLRNTFFAVLTVLAAAASSQAAILLEQSAATDLGQGLVSYVLSATSNAGETINGIENPNIIANGGMGLHQLWLNNTGTFKSPTQGDQTIGLWNAAYTPVDSFFYFDAANSLSVGAAWDETNSGADGFTGLPAGALGAPHTGFGTLSTAGGSPGGKLFTVASGRPGNDVDFAQLVLKAAESVLVSFTVLTAEGVNTTFDDFCIGMCEPIGGGVLTIDPALATDDPAVPAQLISQQFNALLDGGATTADSWSITGFTKGGVAAVPANPPSISSTGLFSWLPTLADLGPVGADADWQALIQATKAGSDNASATFDIGLTIPEPTTMSLFGLAMVGAIGFLRRR